MTEKNFVDYYEILGIVDIEKVYTAKDLRKIYIDIMRQNHPDNLEQINSELPEGEKTTEEELNETSKKITVAYDELKKIFKSDENRKSYNEEVKRKREEKDKATLEIDTDYYGQTYKRRDGSRISIKEVSMGKTYDTNFVAKYKIKEEINQNNIKIIRESYVYGKIDIVRLDNDFEYCDYALNNLLSRKHIEDSQKSYSGYLGLIEETENGIMKIVDDKKDLEFYENNEWNDAYNQCISLNRRNGTTIDLQKIGIMSVGGIKQEIYKYRSYDLEEDGSKIKEGVIFGDIDFRKIMIDRKYASGVANALLDQRRLNMKEKMYGGYIGELEVEDGKYSIYNVKQIEKTMFKDKINDLIKI